MDKIKITASNIAEVDSILMEKVQNHLDTLTKPQGSLGMLEVTAKRIAGITGKEKPNLSEKVIFTLAADHGVCDEGVSLYPKKVTAQMVYNFLAGGAAINVLARLVGARVVVADLGVAEDLSPKLKLIVKKINYGTKNMAAGPAMTREEAISSIVGGIDIFETELKNGISIAGTGEMGIGNTTASSAITACFTNLPVKEVTGKGTGLDETGLLNKIRCIEKAIKINKPDPADPIDVLAKVGGFEIGGLSGVILAAAAKRIPVIIDGFISGAAALIAYKIEPKVKDYLIAGHCSLERGHRHILALLGLEPLLDLKLRLGEGTGAALAMSLCDASIKILTEMATFKNAGVSRPE